MKKKTNVYLKICCMVLALLTLAGMFTACFGKVSSDGSNGTNDGEFNGNLMDPESAPVAYMTDFEGYEFRVLTRGAGAWTSNDIVGESLGNVVDQAVYNRNEIVSREYNFTVVETRANDWVAMAENTAMSGSSKDSFDMWSFKANDITPLAQEGFLYDLNDVSYMRLDAAYYDQALREQGSFANYVFFLTGDLIYQDDMATAIMTFNADMWDQFLLGSVYGVSSMYELVDEGKWTLEAFSEFARLTTVDNGDGVPDERDYWGFNYENGNILSLNIAANNELLYKDENDIFVLNRSEKQMNDMEKIMKLLNSGYAYSSLGNAGSLFTKNVQFIEMNWVSALPGFVASGVNFGVIPPCKADETQKEYRSFITTYGSNCITICKNVEDANKTASIIELLSYQSRQTVTPKLSTYLFDGRIVPNENDSRMLRYIIDHRCYELCYLWSVGSLYSTMIGVNNADGQGLASALESSEDAVRESIARKLERLQNLA